MLPLHHHSKLRFEHFFPLAASSSRDSQKIHLMLICPFLFAERHTRTVGILVKGRELKL
uniref:Glutathione peroxidase n=1 Tax=Rhizophora mucronata TaxID=61149 RepID=A0A2P2KM50_RHIMU